MEELLSAYLKYAESQKLKAELLESSFGHMVVKIWGNGAGKVFQWESGQHIVQRIPPTEHNGRRQTSVVSVGILSLPPDREQKPLPESELEIEPTKGTGPGGQHKNVTLSAIRARHLPTGLQVVIDGRDQHSNKRMALRILTAKVNELIQQKEHAEYNADRRSKMGTGGRGEKVRTYNFLQNRVVDHRTGKKTSNVKGVMKGDFSLILK